MLRKKFIIPWFGKYPDWLNKWVSNMEMLKPFGYDYEIFSNLELFKNKIRERLEIEPIIEEGSGKPWDYRAMLGVLFEEELRGYDMWGHTDFDCVYGNPDHFIPDSFLEKYDIYANHIDYVSGPWSLYKNCEKVNNLFRKCDWKKYVLNPEPTGWVEMEFTEAANANVNIKYVLYQTRDWDNFSTLRRVGNELYEGNQEVFMAHFRRTKEYPDV